MAVETDLRKKIRAKRKQLSANEVVTASSLILKKILRHPIFIRSKHVAYYVPDENEIDTSFIAHQAQQLKKLLYLPIFSKKNKLIFYFIDSNTQFKKNKLGILEPIILNQSPISLFELDLILIPLVAFDRHCNRLGRGIGCYDRTLEFSKQLSQNQRPTLMGLAYEFQKVDKIIRQEWDVEMDYIITENNNYQNPGSKF